MVWTNTERWATVAITQVTAVSKMAGFRVKRLKDDLEFLVAFQVTGLDVFLWILLTAGSIGFPMLVLTICCIKRQ